jgi:radical SAM superfamily enzyme YgiQ (UPF0313 family)
MKVLLVQPPIEDFYDTSIRTYPLGLLYVAAAGGDIADVVVLDARTGRKPERLGEHEFHGLEPFYKKGIYTPFSFFSHYSRFGFTFSEIKRAVEKEKPDVVAVASMCSAYEKQALEVAMAAKEASREVVTVMGGIHPTLFPERLLSHRDVDYCVRGEGETPFFELVSALSHGNIQARRQIGGLCFKERGRLHLSSPNVESDINQLPGRQFLDSDRYRINKKRYTFFLTSRGCPFSCGFCGKPPVPYRKRSIGSIVAEVDACAGSRIEAIDFEDDMLNLDKSFFTAVLELFVDRGMTLSAMNGIYPANMDAPTLELMYRAGFRRLNFSLVDLSESILATQGRTAQRSFVQLLPFLDRSPFLVEVHFIIGLPGQRPADLLDTLCFLMGQRLLLGPSIFYLSPGSPASASLDAARDVPLQSMRSSVMLPLNPLFPRTVTYTLVKLVRFINYVKQLLDRYDGITRAGDLLNSEAVAADGRRQVIFERLLLDKKFVYYDPEQGCAADEPVDDGLVRTFFERAKGARIKGYRTGKTLVMDVE